LKAQMLDKLLYKIVQENLATYYLNFKNNTDNQIDFKQFDEYLQNLARFLYENVYDKKLTISLLKHLHKEIYKGLTIEKAKLSWPVWAFRDGWSKIRVKLPNSKIVNIPAASPKELEKLINLQLEKLNLLVVRDKNNWSDNWEKKIEKFCLIVESILNLLKIHPFYDGNWKVFRILLDVMLLKENFFPVFPLKNKKALFGTILVPYAMSFSDSQLVNNFLNFVISRYKNYKF